MVASAYVGMLSAIAIPSFQKARSNSMEKSCQNNRRILDAAKEQWALENGKTNGNPVTEADITEYIKGGFPALQCPKGGTLTITAPACSVHGPLH
jgi:type II secretory pathway pseudopilin PulG